MKQERNFIYSKDICMPDQRCDGYPLYLNNLNHLDDDISFNLILSNKDEYYIEVGIKRNLQDKKWTRDWFDISMERPMFIQEPIKNLTHDEKILLNNYFDKLWSFICSEIKRHCIEDCINNGGGCDKFYNRTIPTTHPDYRKLSVQYNEN